MQQIKQDPYVISNASKLSVGIVVARFNSEFSALQLEMALKALKECSVPEKNIVIVHVAGSMEIPTALHAMAISRKFNCLVALGCVIKGKTKHFDYVCKHVQEGILRVSLDFGLPIGFGVLAVETPAQARSRVDIGRNAALAALELAKIKI